MSNKKNIENFVAFWETLSACVFCYLQHSLQFCCCIWLLNVYMCCLLLAAQHVIRNWKFGLVIRWLRRFMCFFLLLKMSKIWERYSMWKKTERLCVMERLKKFGSSLGENTCSNVQYSQFTVNIYYFEKTIQAIHVTILALESMFVVQIGRFKTTCFT